MKKFYSSFLVVSLFVFAAANKVSAQIPVSIYELEPNDASGTAHVLNLGAQNVTIVRGSINPGGDLDYFRIDGVAAGSRIWLVTDPGGTQVAGATSRDLVMDLLGSDGTTVIENDDDDGTGNGGDGTVETGLAATIGGRVLVTGGTYYIRLRAFSVTGIVNPYRILIAVTSGAVTSPEVEANNTAATANPTVATMSVRTGSIGVAGDQDYYAVTLQAGNILVISADADPERDGTGTDLVVEVRDPADAILLSFDSGITGSLANPSCESANYTITTSGTYFVKVRHFSASGTGTYDVMIAGATGSALAATPLIITEFRVRGPSGANDEYVEVYNTSNTPYTVSASDGSLGYSVASSDATVRFIIPNGTVIPQHGHYLGTNSVAYSLSSYPAGNGTTATGDATFTTDIPDNAGIGLFRTSIPANFSLTTRLDAVGSTSEANTLYKEGTGYPALTPFSIDYDFRRKTYTTPPVDTDNNAADFEFDDTNGTSAGAGQRLGAPGPENLSGPVSRDGNVVITRLDQTVGPLAAPNFVRDLTSDPAQNSTFGTIELRYRVTNNTGVPITRLRFRIDSIWTFPAPAGFADLRTRTTASIVVAGVNDPATCGGPTPCSVTVEGTTMEQPPSQPNGGAFNTTMSVDAVTLGTPLAAGASINMRMLFGIQQTGIFNLEFTPEILPASAVSGPVAPSEIISGPTDAPPCVLTCPANITQSNDPNQCGAVVTYPPPTITGTCGTVTVTPASGSFFPVGTTTVTATSSVGPSCTFTITVNDTQPPTITCPSNMNVCGGAQAVSFTVTASDNCPGVTVVSVPASGSVFPVGTTTVTSTATDGAGNTATCSFTVTVYPQPTVNAVPNQVRCNGALTAAVNFSGAVPGTIFDWTNNTPSIGLAASGTGNIGSFNAINTGTTPVTATITVTPSTNSAIFSQTYNFTGAVQTLVIPAGVTSVNIQAFGAQGNSNAMSVAGGLGGSASGTLAVSPGNTLFINVGGGGTVSVNGGFNGGGNAGSSTCLTARAGGGGGASDVGLNANTLAARVLVAAGGGGAAGNRILGCGRGTGGGGGAGLYGGGGGAGWPSASLVVPTGGTQVAGGIGGTSTFSPVNNGFPGGLGFGGPGGGEVGSNQAGNNTGSVGATGGGLIGSDGTYAGNFVGQSGAGGSSYTGGVTSGSTTPGVRSGNGQVIISYIVPGPATICTGTPTTFTITVNPTPDAVATPTSQTICSGASITPITISGNVSGTAFNWVRNNTATVTGIAASGSGNISGTLTNTTNAPVTVAFTITPVANGCPGIPVIANVVVNPNPVVNPVASRTVCFGSTVPAITFTSPTTGGTIVYNWTNSNTAIGLGASGTGNLPSFIATNATSAPITGTITVTATYTNVVTCVGSTSITFTITVAPNTTVDPVPNQTVCANTLTAPVNFTSPSPGAVFTWTNNTTSIGLAASGNGNIPAFTATNVTPNPVTATVTVTPNYIIGAPATITLPPQGATFTGNVRGYWFTAPTSFTMTSLFVPTDASSGAQSIAVMRMTGAVPPPVFPGTTNAFTTLFVTQNNPAPGNIPVNLSINSGDVICIMGYRATVNSYTAAGSPVTTTISGFPVSLTRMGMQFPLTTTLPQQLWQEPSVASISRVLFEYTTAVSCPGTPRTFTITVNPIPTITCPANMTVPTVIPTCTAPVNYTPTVTGVPAPTLTYTFSGATTGSGSGSGSGSLFNIGTTTVTITATNICGTASCSFTITVIDSQTPVITALTNQFVCLGNTATFTAVSTFASSYQWQSWNGSAWVNIAGATTATYTIPNVTHAMNASSFRVRVTGPCGTTTTSNHAVLYVNALPTVSIAASGPTALLPIWTVTLTATVSPTGGTVVWYKNNVVIPGATGLTLGPLNVLDAGTYRIVYTDLNGCVNTSNNITISALLTGNLYIYPNPNTGQFHIRFYNAVNEEATVTVYNYLGAIVYQKKHMTGPLQYSIIDVDLGKRLAIGTYIVDVRNAQNLRIGAKLISVGRE